MSQRHQTSPLQLLTRGRNIELAEAAAELAGGALCATSAILIGLVKAEVVDPKGIRAFLQSLVDDLSPAERHLAYGFSLSQVIDALDRTALSGTPPATPAKGRHH